MELYIAKDEFNIVFFKDKPDIIKFNEDEYEWTGYPFSFGDFIEIKNYFIEQYKDIKPFSCIKIVIEPNKFNNYKLN